MTININTNRFSTFDLGLATALITCGHRLIKLDNTNPTKIRFVFEEDKDIEQVMLKYWDGKLKVSALSFFNNLKTLKNRLYSSNE